MLYGQSSEKTKFTVENTDGEQLGLFNEAEIEANQKVPEPKTTTVAAHERKVRRTHEELAADLPVKEVLCEIPEDERSCDKCGNDESHDAGLPDIEPKNIIKATPPKPVIEHSVASPSAVAYVMYEKYVNATPLNRMEADLKSKGLIISRATLAN